MLRASARARTAQIDPGRDGELARRVSHDVAAWSAKPRHRATRERTPSNSNRARRRTKLEVHGDARTRPVSARLQKRKETPSRTVPGPLLSPFKAPSGVHAREGRQLSDSERTAFAKCVHFAQRCGQASVADVCKEWGISKSHGYKILNRWRTEENVQSRPRSGRPRALTEEDMKMLESLSEEVKGDFTWESLAKRFRERTGKRVSCTTVYNSCKTAGWRALWTACLTPFFSPTINLCCTSCDPLDLP